MGGADAGTECHPPFRFGFGAERLKNPAVGVGELTALRWRKFEIYAK